MELRVLKYYLMVAREENITKAAELLHITQPTLSRQLRQLEEELGVCLFQRGKHSIILTEEGLLLKRRAQELIDLAGKTKRDLTCREEALTGTISIGSGETKSMNWLAARMAEFHRLHPGVNFDIYSTTADSIKDRIERGLADIGLLTEPVNVEKYQLLRLPQKARWGVLVRQDSALAQKPFVRAEDLTGIPVLLARREMVRSELANWFGDTYERLDVAATYNLLSNAAILVKAIQGAALCMEYDTQHEGLAFIPLSPILETGSVLVWKKSQFFSAATARFLDYINDVGRRENRKEDQDDRDHEE